MSNNVHIVNQNDFDFNPLWQKYLDNNPHSFINTLEGIDYIKSYNNFINDLSFIVIKNDIPQGIAFLPLELNDNCISLTISNSYIPMPLSINDTIEKLIFLEIEKIVKVKNIKYIKMQQNTHETLENNIFFNKMKNYNFLESNTLNLTINLTLSKEELWSKLRRRFKSQINKFTKYNIKNLFIMNKDNAKWEHQKAYWDLHCKIAGKYARGIELFEYQYKLIEKGMATLFYIQEENEYIHFNLFIHHNYTVIYASSVSAVLEERPPLSHFTLWNANLYFKNLHYKVMQYGQPATSTKFSGIDDITDDKGLAISHFKRGMGAIPITQYRGIKFYDKMLLKQHLDNFYLQYQINEE